MEFLTMKEYSKAHAEDIEEYFKLPENRRVGIISRIDLRECKTEDNKEFVMIDIFVDCGKERRKSYGVDFLRKYLKQLDLVVDDLIGKVVVITIKNDKYRTVSNLAFVAKDEDGGLDIVSYVDDKQLEVMEKLRKLF